MARSIRSETSDSRPARPEWIAASVAAKAASIVDVLRGASEASSGAKVKLSRAAIAIFRASVAINSVAAVVWRNSVRVSDARVRASVAIFVVASAAIRNSLTWVVRLAVSWFWPTTDSFKDQNLEVYSACRSSINFQREDVSWASAVIRASRASNSGDAKSGAGRTWASPAEPMSKAAGVVDAATASSPSVGSGPVDEPSRASPPGVEIEGASVIGGVIGGDTWSPC